MQELLVVDLCDLERDLLIQEPLSLTLDIFLFPLLSSLFTRRRSQALSAPPPLYTETLYRLGERLSRNRVRRNSGISGIFSYEILTFLSALDRFPNFSGQVDKSPGILLELSKDCTK